MIAHVIWTLSTLPSAASALQSSISALEREITALESQSSGLEPWLGRFTLLVAIGVALEIFVVIHDHGKEINEWRVSELIPKGPSLIKLGIEIASIILVIAGVMGEFGVGLSISSINGQLRAKSAELRSKSDQLLALVTQQAGEAKDSAVIAKASAKAAGIEASKALDTSKAANDAAGKAQEKIGVVAKRAEKIDSDLINFALCNAPRVIRNWSMASGGVSKSYVDPLRPMAGQIVFLEVTPNDAEARRAASEIARTLSDSQWSIQIPPRFVEGISDGVSVQPSATLPAGLAKGDASQMAAYWQTQATADKLLDFLHSYNWQAARGWPLDPQGNLIHDDKVLPAGAIRVQVGLYPPAVYVSPQGGRNSQLAWKR